MTVTCFDRPGPHRTGTALCRQPHEGTLAPIDEVHHLLYVSRWPLLYKAMVEVARLKGIVTTPGLEREVIFLYYFNLCKFLTSGTSPSVEP